MPNHIHLLISVYENWRGDPSPTVLSFVGWLKYQATKEINIAMNTLGQKQFQRSYHDHAICNRADYEEVSRYIYENPINWEKDEFYN